MKQSQILNGIWLLQTEEGECIETKVPGSVCAAFLSAGKLEDPYWRDNEKKILPVMEKDYWFTRTFSVDEQVLSMQEKLLRFEGIDTIAEIYLNGALVGRTENMHRCYEFPVTDMLKQGKNDLKIKIFMWFIHKGVILTKDNLIKRRWVGNPRCCFCDNNETRKHQIGRAHV